VINITESKNLVKFASKLKGMQGIFEVNDTDYWEDTADIDTVIDDNIALTCLQILVSLVNQNMKITSKDKKVQKTVDQFNRKIKIRKKMDSIVFNQLGRGYSVFFYDVTNPKLMVYDTSTIKYLVKDTRVDEFLGIYQVASFADPEQQKKGITTTELVEQFIPADDNLILVPGIGKGDGQSLLLTAYPFVKAKQELVNSLYDLVKRLGLLMVIGVDLPGDVSDDDTGEYLDEIEALVQQAKANSTWILPKETEVKGVTGSGEARVIESVKTLIEMLDEEIRKCLFIPDTFLSSLSANRATAKEQRYLIASMVDHIRDLIEEALYDVYDQLLLYHGLPLKYEFTWGNINLPEPEALFTFLSTLLEFDGITTDEVRGFINMGLTPKELKRLQKQKNKMVGQNIYQQMGYNQNREGDKRWMR
jgi:hypothetical protein